MVGASVSPPAASGAWSRRAGAKSEYGRFMSRSQSRTAAGTGKNSPKGTSRRLSYHCSVAANATIAL